MAEPEFDTTLDALEESRRAAEADYLAHVEGLEERVAEVVALTRAAEAAVREAVLEAEGRQSTAVTEVASPVDLPPSPGMPEQQPWPVGRGLRGVVNRGIHWILRDYLAVLDQRHGAVGGEVADLATAHQREQAAGRGLATTVAAAVAEYDSRIASLREEVGRLGDGQELQREGLNRAAEALDMVSGASLRLRTLVNSKDAEVIQRLAGAQSAKVEVVLDELARRQEALLAELVGKREELEELVRRVETPIP